MYEYGARWGCLDRRVLYMEAKQGRPKASPRRHRDGGAHRRQRANRARSRQLLRELKARELLNAHHGSWGQCPMPWSCGKCNSIIYCCQNVFRRGFYVSPHWRTCQVDFPGIFYDQILDIEVDFNPTRRRVGGFIRLEPLPNPIQGFSRF